MIEVKTVFDFESTQAFNRYLMKKLRKLPYLMAVSFIFLGLVLFLVLEDITYRISFLVCFSLAGIMMPFLLKKAIEKGNLKQAESSKLLNKETINYFKFEEDKVFLQTTKGGEYQSEGTSSYSQFNKVVETKTHFFLYLSLNQAYSIPKKDIIVGDEQELSKLLSSKFGDKFVFDLKC